jgi:hypothetical protein
VVGDLALLKREFEETRHRLIVTQQALTVAEQALEDIVVQHKLPSDVADPAAAVVQHARDALRSIHTVLKQVDQGVDKGS